MCRQNNVDSIECAGDAVLKQLQGALQLKQFVSRYYFPANTMCNMYVPVHCYVLVYLLHSLRHLAAATVIWWGQSRKPYNSRDFYSYALENNFPKKTYIAALRI
jgi:hypothetical protein